MQVVVRPWVLVIQMGREVNVGAGEMSFASPTLTSVAVAQLTTAKPVELSWKWLSQADGSAFQTPRLGLAW